MPKMFPIFSLKKSNMQPCPFVTPTSFSKNKSFIPSWIQLAPSVCAVSPYEESARSPKRFELNLGTQIGSMKMPVNSVMVSLFQNVYFVRNYAERCELAASKKNGKNFF